MTDPVLIVFVIGMLFIAVLSYMQDLATLREQRKVSSRFPMFAARDELVLLIARGEMSENDKIWLSMYHAANDTLRLDRRHDFFELLRRSIEAERKNDPGYALFRKRLQEAKARVPAFKRAADQVNTALVTMSIERTSLYRFAGRVAELFCMYALLTLMVALANGFTQIGRTYKLAKRVLQPDGSPASAWAAYTAGK